MGCGGEAHIEQNRKKSNQESIIIIIARVIAIIIQQRHLFYQLFRRRPENLSDRLILGTNKGASGWYARSNRVIMIMIIMTLTMRMIKCDNDKTCCPNNLKPKQMFSSGDRLEHLLLLSTSWADDWEKQGRRGLPSGRGLSQVEPGPVDSFWTGKIFWKKLGV